MLLFLPLLNGICLVALHYWNMNYYDIGVLLIPHQYDINIGKNFIVSAKCSAIQYVILSAINCITEQITDFWKPKSSNSKDV